MELWHSQYPDILKIPYSRRKRFVEEKENLERKRLAKAKANAAASRVRRRR